MLSRTEYLAELGLTFDDEAMAAVIEAEHFFFTVLGCPEAEAVFIGTASDDEGVTSYGTLWYFSETHICSAANFRQVTAQDYSVRLRGSIVACQLSLQGCNFDELHQSANMTVQFVTETNLQAAMRAHGQNCRQLLDVVKGYLLPAR